MDPWHASIEFWVCACHDGLMSRCGYMYVDVSMLYLKNKEGENSSPTHH